MKYARGGLMESPSVEGVIDGATISLFSAQRQNEDERKNRMMSVMEISLPHGMIDGGAAGTSEMLPFMQTLDTLKPMQIEHEHWQASFTMMGRNQEMLKKYFTPQRLEALAHILVLKNADILVMFDGNTSVVRVETVDPMLQPAKLDKIIKRILEDGKKLAIDASELKSIQQGAASAPDPEKIIESAQDKNSVHAKHESPHEESHGKKV